VTLDATVNPDFSQVESDAFQVEVNQRYPIFFSEKRPFFMEGAGLFNLAGVGDGDGNMVSSVHTAADRRSDRRRQGHRIAGTHDLRRAHGGRPGRRPRPRGTESVERSRQGVHGCGAPR
jgi:hypothetical protein